MLERRAGRDPSSFDLMLHNDKSTPPFPVLQKPVIALPKQPGDQACSTRGEKY